MSFIPDCAAKSFADWEHPYLTLDPAYEAEGHFGWVACDNRTTRAVAKILREDYRIPRTSIKAQAYWAEGA